ncbi:MAG: BspA family leucine-rich repeat surface protein [Clostridia bacterium]|nr:BspA family leucine-rich repeat surface protein [Clostridia bacterium]
MKKVLILTLLFVFILSLGCLANAATLPEGGVRAILNLNDNPIDFRLLNSISFTNGISIPADAIDSWDVVDGSVTAWITEESVIGYSTERDLRYNLFVGSNEKIYAPANSKCYFAGLPIRSISLNNFDTSNVTNMLRMFAGCNEIYTLSLTGFNTQNVTIMRAMFEDCVFLTDIYGTFDTRNVTDMGEMFLNCYFLRDSINDFLSGFNTSKVTKMDYMFTRCAKLTHIDLSNFDMHNVTNMSYMFWGCYALNTIDFGDDCNASGVTTMMSMFNECSSLTELDLSSVSTKYLTNIESMFEGCTNLKSLKLNAFGGVTINSAKKMFKDCINLEEIFIDLPEYDLPYSDSTPGETTDMFKNCNKLKSIIIDENVYKNGVIPFWNTNSRLDDIQPTLYVKNSEAETKFEANENYMNMFGADRIVVYNPEGQAEIIDLMNNIIKDFRISVEDIRIMIQFYVHQ